MKHARRGGGLSDEPIRLLRGGRKGEWGYVRTHYRCGEVGHSEGGGGGGVSMSSI